MTKECPPTKDKKARILIVDDDHCVARLVKAVLERQGHDVDAAFDGVEGLEKVREFKPDLIILDVVMPAMNGYEVCRRLQKDHATAHIAVLMLSSGDETRAQARGFAVGATDYMTKPVMPEQLIQHVRAVLWSSGIKS